MRVKIFLAGGYREEVLMIQEEVESVLEEKHRSDAWCLVLEYNAEGG